MYREFLVFKEVFRGLKLKKMTDLVHTHQFHSQWEYFCLENKLGRNLERQLGSSMNKNMDTFGSSNYIRK